MAGAAGHLVQRAIDIGFALRKGFLLTLSAVTPLEFRTLQLIDEEVDSLREERDREQSGRTR